MSPICASEAEHVERGAWSVERCALRSTLYALLIFALSACTVTRPTIKLGLVAPFEGRYRSVGYDVIWAVRLAVREANEQDLVTGYGVELVALDDMGDPDRAREQAAKLAVDPQVVVVLGHWLVATTTAAADDYASAGLALLAAGGVEADPQVGRLPLWNVEDCLLRTSSVCLETTAGQQTDLAGSVCTLAPLALAEFDPGFVNAYRALSGGAAPGPAAALAYDGARALIQAMRQAAADGRPDREAVSAAVSDIHLEGVSGTLTWSADGRREGLERRGYRLDSDGVWVAEPAACP
jgi:ABC-type branched-subunit amino acid transport system substrate-binding protein